MSYFYESLARIDAKLTAEERAEHALGCPQCARLKSTPTSRRTVRRNADVIDLVAWKAARENRGKE